MSVVSTATTNINRKLKQVGKFENIKNSTRLNDANVCYVSVELLKYYCLENNFTTHNNFFGCFPNNNNFYDDYVINSNDNGNNNESETNKNENNNENKNENNTVNHSSKALRQDDKNSSNYGYYQSSQIALWGCRAIKNLSKSTTLKAKYIDMGVREVVEMLEKKYKNERSVREWIVIAAESIN